MRTTNILHKNDLRSTSQVIVAFLGGLWGRFLVFTPPISARVYLAQRGSCVPFFLAPFLVVYSAHSFPLSLFLLARGLCTREV